MSSLVRRAVLQKLGLNLGIETAPLRVHESARHVLRIPVSKVELSGPWPFRHSR